MSLSERLAFLISVNSDDAIHGFQKIGAAADRDLGKVDNRIDKFGRTATKVGAGMLAFAGVAGGALIEFAHKSEEAQHAQILLQNALSNSPSLTGASAEGFEKLATSIQNKTAAENDSIVAGIATLAQFRLTEAQINQLTQLLVDYARRTGKDMPTAAQDLGKAILGQGRALKAIGVQFTDTKDAGKNFDEVVTKLRESVGGFAEQEGATFSGSLARLHNQLGDLEEGIGKGVVDAFTSALGPISRFSARIAETNPQTQELIGRLAAVGTAGIGAVGGLSLMAGQLVKMRDRFVVTEGAAAGTLTTFGKLAGFAGLATVALGVYEVGQAAKHVQIDVENLSRATTNELVKAFDKADKSASVFQKIKDSANPALVVRELLKGNPGGIGDYDNQQREFFKKLAEGSIGTARALRNELKGQGRDVKDLDKILADETKSQKRANDRATEGADAFDATGNAAASAAPKIKTLGERLNDIATGAFEIGDAEDKVTADLDSLQEKANANAKGRADSARTYAKVVEDSNRRIRDAEQGVSDAREDLNKISSGDRTDARRRLRDAQENLADTRKDAATNIAQAKQNTDDWSASLDRNTAKGRENRGVMEDIVTETLKGAAALEAQGAPASEINGFIQRQLDKLKNVGTQLGFNKGALQEFLNLLTYAEQTVSPSVLGAGSRFATGSFGLGGDANPAKPDGVDVLVVVNAQPGSNVSPDFARSVGNEVGRQVTRRFQPV